MVKGGEGEREKGVKADLGGGGEMDLWSAFRTTGERCKLKLSS